MEVLDCYTAHFLKLTEHCTLTLLEGEFQKIKLCRKLLTPILPSL